MAYNAEAQRRYYKRHPERIKEKQKKWNAKNPLYKTWYMMNQRCHNEDFDRYEDWGGRGIEVCHRWSEDLNALENFIEDMGERPEGCTLDRIDPDGHYEPDNCRWATVIEQANNKRNTYYVEVYGVRKPIQIWAEELNIKPKTIWARINKYGWEPIDALGLRDTQLELDI